MLDFVASDLLEFKPEARRNFYPAIIAIRGYSLNQHERACVRMKNISSKELRLQKIPYAPARDGTPTNQKLEVRNLIQLVSKWLVVGCQRDTAIHS